jgi:hypothetical protein
MREEFNPLIKSCATKTISAAKTKSIGLQADARVVMVFALHLDNFIVIRKFCPLIGTTPSGQIHHDSKRSSTYRDFAKTHANPDTDGNIIKPPGRYSAFWDRFYPKVIQLNAL